MKVLFFTAREATDHLASCLWDGLQEVVGERNVYDAVGHRLLHPHGCDETMWREGGADRFGTSDVLSGISGRRFGRHLSDEDWDFDLFVINAAFLRELTWEFIRVLLPRLGQFGKVVYVEGWDSPYQVHPPEVPVDAVFRKEIDPGYSYPYTCEHLTFAAPARWFSPEDQDIDRPFDVFYSGTSHSNDQRWGILSGVFSTRRRHHSVVSSKHLGLSVPGYFEMYRRSKLALCPTSAEYADSLRTYEAVACGAIPIFVAYPNRVRENWFHGEHCFQCAGTREIVAEHIDAALDRDLPTMRRNLLDYAAKYHTTAARARKVLTAVGLL